MVKRRLRSGERCLRAAVAMAVHRRPRPFPGRLQRRDPAGKSLEAVTGQRGRCQFGCRLSGPLGVADAASVWLRRVTASWQLSSARHYSLLKSNILHSMLVFALPTDRLGRSAPALAL